jgi:hypothetical protein
VNKVSVRNAKDPMPTGQGDGGTKLLSPFEDGHYSSVSPQQVLELRPLVSLRQVWSMLLKLH